MADVLGRPFTRLRCLAVSPPLGSLPQVGGLGRAALLDVGFLPRLRWIQKRVNVQEPCVKDPRTLFSNLNILRVLYAKLHLWRMEITDFIVNFFSFRVLVVKALLL